MILQLHAIQRSFAGNSCHVLARAMLISRLDHCNILLGLAPKDLFGQLSSVTRAGARLIMELLQHSHMTRTRLHLLDVPSPVRFVFPRIGSRLYRRIFRCSELYNESVLRVRSVTADLTLFHVTRLRQLGVEMHNVHASNIYIPSFDYNFFVCFRIVKYRVKTYGPPWKYRSRTLWTAAMHLTFFHGEFINSVEQWLFQSNIICWIVNCSFDCYMCK